jgi:hypothetical protein
MATPDTCARDTVTLLDGAAILGTLEAFDSRNMESVSVWALKSAIETTTALLLVPKLHLSPIPEIRNAPTGPYGDALARLSEWVDQSPFVTEHRAAALTTTRRWAGRNTARLAQILGQLREDPSYVEWFGWLRRNQWEDHVRRHGGLFELAFLAPIGRALGVSTTDLQKIWETPAVDLRSALGVESRSQERCTIVEGAFTLSTLLRGRYYESLARKSFYHVLHHPIRAPVLAPLSPKRVTDVPLPNTASYLAIVVVAAAFNTRRQTRAANWVAAMRSARASLSSGELDVSPKASDEIALRVAAREASRLDLATHPRWVDYALNAAMSAGTGVIASLALSSFETVGTSFATALALEATGAVERATHIVSSRHSRLEAIARLGAGRITPHWRAGDAKHQV